MSNNDAQDFQPATPAHVATAAPGLHLPPQVAQDAVADIGYEAAYPALQTPDWIDAMLGQPNAGHR